MREKNCHQRRQFRRLILILLIIEYILMTGDLFVRTQEKKMKLSAIHLCLEYKLYYIYYII